MPRRYETLEMMQHKISMSQKVSEKDQDYAKYAGANVEEAYTMALLDHALTTGMFSEHTAQIIKKYRLLLDKQRKAYFAAVSSEITKLGFILGTVSNSESALAQVPESDRPPVP